MEIEIRDSEPDDAPALMSLLRGAFPDEDLVPIVADLLSDPGAEPRVSLVAERGGTTVGHVLFTAARVEGEVPVRATLLAPLSVDPGAQRQGIGTGLVNGGLARLSQSDGPEVVCVFGDPGYYRKFGFEPAGAQGIAPPFPLPYGHADAWMALFLDPAARGEASGRLRPARAFDRPELWRE